MLGGYASGIFLFLESFLSFKKPELQAETGNKKIS